MGEAAADIYDPAFVKTVFDRCSGTYIKFSYICSLGFTERWRRQCVAALPEPPSAEPVCYDLMAGTGEVWPHLLRRFPNPASIVAVDISSGMHQLAMARLHQHRAHHIAFVEDDVLATELAPASADLIVSTFGLKTFNPAQQSRLAATIARALKPGGAFALIEASDPKGWLLRHLYLFHLKRVLPLIERLFLRGAQDFAMIGHYTTDFGDARGMAEALRAEGLDVTFRRHFFGCATSVSGRRPVVIAPPLPHLAPPPPLRYRPRRPTGAGIALAAVCLFLGGAYGYGIGRSRTRLFGLGQQPAAHRANRPLGRVLRQFRRA